MIKLYQGDMLKEMDKIADGSVDLILTDLPYQITANSWDQIIPFEDMWKQYNRVIKDNGAIVLFSNQPFTTKLIASNIDNYKFGFVWDKKIPAGMTYARYRPMQQTEDVNVFAKGNNKLVYIPQMVLRDKPIKSGGNNVMSSNYNDVKGIGEDDYKKTYTHKFPTNLIKFNKVRRGALHPTQKPVELLEYLIKTYTQENETVLDSTMGSGSTGVAAKRTNRRFIGIELDEEYFKIAEERIAKTQFIQQSLDI